ncbi:MAG: response regulator [Halioglobus sp.]|nr:response regulator [Halioglobus sp.]
MKTAGTVLLVEDNELNRNMMVRRLKRAGLDVLTADNGQQALDTMLSAQPSIVLMDMNLPIMDGWAASRRAKEDDNISHIPIIALTAHATEDHKAYALQAGCDDYATKPVDFPGLLVKIQKLMRS